MADRRGFIKKPDEKTQPARLIERPSNELGDSHHFNIKGKVTKMGGSYHDMGKCSGECGNFDDKDASNEYLEDRGKQGQVVYRYSNNTYNSKEHTFNIGQTAYNSLPIDQVYKPATSRGIPCSEAVRYEYEDKQLSSVKAAEEDDAEEKNEY